MRCPNCKLINPATAERCDCGFEFASGRMRASLLTGRDMELRLEKEQERISFTSKGIILRVLSRLGMVGVAAAVAVGVGGFSAVGYLLDSGDPKM